MATKKTTAKKKTARKVKAESKPKASLGAKKKISSAKSRKTTRKVTLTPEQLFVETQQLAYFLAEKDGFSRNPTHYWLDAETAVAKK